MTAPLPLPIRVLIKGASTVHTVSYMNGPRADFAYPRALEAALLSTGQVAEVRTTAMASERTKTALKNWESEIYSWSPDVVVLNYGHFETIHLLLPQPLERHANSLRNRPGRIASRYHQLLRKSWKLLARAQQRCDKALPSTMFRRRPARVTIDMEQLIKRIQMVGSPLILVMELTPPGAPFRRWFPGMAERMEVMNDALAEAVRRVDMPDVRLFPTAAALAPLTDSGVEVNPDGGHYTPAAHRLLGNALSDEILTWAAHQVHLRDPDITPIEPTRTPRLHDRGERQS